MNCHEKATLSRRDDLQSLCYMLLRFLRGNLPWEYVQPNQKKDKMYLKIKNIKQTTTLQTLCHGLPDEFEHVLDYVKNLQFNDTPDYKGIKKHFENVLSENNWTLDYNYDWCSFGSVHLAANNTNCQYQDFNPGK